MIKVNATGDVTNVTVKDTFASDVLIFNNDVQINGNNHTWTPDSTVTNGFGYTTNAMNEGEEVIITYSARVDTSKVKDLTRVTADKTKNTVSVEKEGGTPHTAEYSREIELKKLTKSNGTANPTQDVENKTIYDWTIEYNSIPLVPVGGDTVTDKIADASKPYMNYYGDGITVCVYDAYGHLVRTDNVAYSQLSNYTADSYTWSYTIPAADTNPYKYVISYQTIVDKEAVQQTGTDQTINNSVSTGGQTSWGGISVTAGEKATITKAVSDKGITNGEQWVEWKSVIHVPSTGLTSAVVTDTFPRTYYGHIGFPGNWDPVYDTYIEGTLQIEGTLENESWEITSRSDDKLVITFYKDQNKTTPGLTGVSPNGHDITVTLKTKVDSDWLSYNYQNPTDNNSKDHTNTIDINGNPSATATTQFVPKTIEKTGSNIGSRIINGLISPVFT